MSEIEWALDESDIEWTYREGHPEAEQIFEPEKALAHLLMNGVVHIASQWWKEELPSDVRKLISVHVDCSDVFAWACSDGEELPHKEIENVYRMWRKDRIWGAAVWCMIRRNQMPQRPVEDRIRAAGIWDLDALKLGVNTMDAEVQAAFVRLALARAQDVPQPS